MAAVSSGESTQGPSSLGGAQNQDGETPASQNAPIQRIQELLRTKNDTSRFVGLALLKSVLDNTPEIQQNETVITQLWDCIPATFLDRLLRTGTSASSSKKDARDMLDLVVAVMHTFALLLPEVSKRDAKLVERIPLLHSALLQSSESSTVLILQTILTLVSFPEGALALVKLEDLSCLLELAPSQPLVLEILSYAFLNSMATHESSKGFLAPKVEQVLQAVISSFSGTDAVTLLSFLADFLRQLDEKLLPMNPPWLPTLVNYIRNLTSSRPTPAARSAYVNLAATLLQVYPMQSPSLLFSDTSTQTDKPFSYLFVNLLLIDLRSSFPTLLEQLNSPEYQATSRRLASDFDAISCFIGYLMRFVDGDDFGSDSGPSISISPDLLLKIRKSMSEAMSVTIEFLRDRWDASVAGVMGLHPDAVAGEANTWRGSHRTIAWDSIKISVGEDPLILSAVRCLAIWLREDDNEVLRKEATGLCDMLMELYKTSAAGKLDFRRPVLVALEGITGIEEGVEALLSHDGWKVLTDDLISLAAVGSSPDASSEGLSRGTEIVRILLPIAEGEFSVSRAKMLDLATAAAAWDVTGNGGGLSAAAVEFYVAALQLVTSVLAKARPAVLKRGYSHTIGAIRGLTTRLIPQIGDNPDLRAELQDILKELEGLG